MLDGYNATVFAYGATGCGKTHTITGTAQQPGIIFLTMQELFEKVDELQSEKESEITLSYLEIYNETIRDLLSPVGSVASKQGLMLREDANQAVSVAGLSSHNPQNVQEVMDMVIRGNASRTQSPTEANATSSRSHAVLQVNISLKDRNASVHEPLTMATLSIIDLAGSERASATKNRGERLLEGANINKSLLALGSCINALCDPRKKNHVPYRNSKLTRLLKFSLGGNCRTVMIVCVSPSSQHFDETQNTLRYANRAKNIQTKSVRNVYNVDRHVKDYLKKIDEQMSRINELTAQQKQYEELAFVKFRKAEAKRRELLQEGVGRLRAAFEHSAEERRGYGGDVRRLRVIERRIGAVSGWIGAFDEVCETREEEEPPPSLAAMRKTAQGILIELEGSREHYHQRLNRSNWSRAIDTALQDGLRQLQSLDGYQPDRTEETALRKELDLLKQRFDLDSQTSLLEAEKSGSESGLMQGMLTAHFETIAILTQILTISEEEAIAAAKSVLGKVLKGCVEATGQVIKPDGGLQITEPVPPTRSGTPRKRRQVPLLGPSPLKSKFRPAVLPPHLAPDLHPSSSPRPSPMGMAGRAQASPRRRVRLGGTARKGVAFAANGSGTPMKKKSPAKKRVVRWRDDEEEGRPLVEFQVTPKGVGSSPPAAASAGTSVRGDGEVGGGGEAPSLPPSLRSGQGEEEEGEDAGSSSLPGIPPTVPSSEIRKAVNGAGRFAAGFLTARKGEGSPPPPPQPSLTLGAFSSSEDESSPLRGMAVNSAPHSLHHQQRERSGVADGSPAQLDRTEKEKENGNVSATDDAFSTTSGSDTEKSSSFPPNDKSTANQIRSAMKLHRSSSVTNNSNHNSHHHNKRESTAHHNHRRRSPTATSHSPPPAGGAAAGEGIFSASHARRMVKSEREEALRSVLSPRTAPVSKGVSGGGRRSLAEGMGSLGTPREGGGGGRGHVRGASVVGSGVGGAGRVSAVGGGVGGGKGIWR